MGKDKDLLSRLGANLAESMGAGRVAGSGPTAAAGDARHEGTTRLKAAALIDVERIAPDPRQPRTEFEPEALGRLAESLKTHGQLQPISVRWSDDMGRYLIVAGERRWRAAKLAGKPSVACVVLDGQPTDEQVLEMQLIENAMREDLQPIEQARAFKTLMDRNGWTAARLAEALHLTGATVSRALALLGLPYTVQEAVAAGDLAPSVAYEVSKLDDPGAQQEIAARAVSENLSRSDVVEAVRSTVERSRPKGRGGRKPRKVITKAFRSCGGRVTVEHRKGLDPTAIRAMLADALAQLGPDPRASEAA